MSGIISGLISLLLLWNNLYYLLILALRPTLILSLPDFFELVFAWQFFFSHVIP